MYGTDCRLRADRWGYEIDTLSAKSLCHPVLQLTDHKSFTQSSADLISVLLTTHLHLLVCNNSIIALGIKVGKEIEGKVQGLNDKIELFTGKHWHRFLEHLPCQGVVTLLFILTSKMINSSANSRLMYPIPQASTLTTSVPYGGSAFLMRGIILKTH